MQVRNVCRVLAPYDKKRSPCVGVCRVVGPAYSRHCCGCWRTIEEIEGWVGGKQKKRLKKSIDPQKITLDWT